MCSIFFLYREYAGQIKPELNIALTPLVGGLGNEGTLIQPAAVGKMQLENVTAGFDIHAHGKRIGAGRMRQAISHIEIIDYQRYAFAKLETATCAKREYIVIVDRRHFVTMHQRGRKLEGEPLRKFSAEYHLVIITRSGSKSEIFSGIGIFIGLNRHACD